MFMIDCHLYVAQIPSQMPEWWIEEMYRPFGGEWVSRGGKEIIELLDEAEVDVGIIQGGDFRRNTYHPDHPTEHSVFISNDYVAGEVAKYPGRLYGQATVDPLRDIQAAIFETERCVKELDFRALALKTAYHHHAANDRRIYPLYEKCVELDIPVDLFTGWTPIINAPLKYSNPIDVDDVARDFRDLDIVVYLAFPWVDECLAVIARHTNVYADMAFFAGSSPEELYEVLLKLKSFGALDRVLYGSDENDKVRVGREEVTVPDLFRSVNDVAAERGTAPITDDELAAIMGGTASRLYKIEQP